MTVYIHVAERYHREKRRTKDADFLHPEKIERGGFTLFAAPPNNTGRKKWWVWFLSAADTIFDGNSKEEAISKALASRKSRDSKRTRDCACQQTKDAQSRTALLEEKRKWEVKLRNEKDPGKRDDYADEIHRIEKELDALETKDAVTRGGMPIKRDDLAREPLKQQLREKPAPKQRANDKRTRDVSPKVQQTFNQIKRRPAILEDRREYMPEDLERMYGLSKPESKELYDLIQREFK